MMIGRCTNLDVGLVPGLMRIRNLIPGTETPQDVVIGDPTGPVGVTVFLWNIILLSSGATINLLGLFKTLLFLSSCNVREFCDIGVKVFAG